MGNAGAGGDASGLARAYAWIVQQPYFRERVYVLGTETAPRGFERAAAALGAGHRSSGMDGEYRRRTDAGDDGGGFVSVARQSGVHRVIVAMPDRRGTLPGGRSCWGLRLSGVKVEEATSWLERISGED